MNICKFFESPYKLNRIIKSFKNHKINALNEIEYILILNKFKAKYLVC